MSAYRFCRTDDIGLLVEALNRCWAPYFPGEPAATPADFKRAIRDLQVWCSSCMVAFAGSDPIGVLIGAKRSDATLIHRIAVHPDHVRQGHARHMLCSLGSKLAILGPPRIIAEVPEAFAAACGLFSACGYVEEAVLTDYATDAEVFAAAAGDTSAHGAAGHGLRAFPVPITVDDLEANGLLDTDPMSGWERAAETIRARKDELTGLAIASEERIEACILFLENGDVPFFRSFVAHGEARLKKLLSLVRGRGVRGLRVPKTHSTDMSAFVLQMLGFRPAASYRRYAATARAE